jgi:5-methylcytosine-specific restriction endonuclease McrA
MMIDRLTDKELLLNLKTLRQREREVLTEILHHLREVERRRLFCDLGYKSLFEYACRELSYSEDEAYRRINAMRLLRELPEIEERIAQGALSLSALSVAGSAFKAEAKKNSPVPVSAKLKLLTALAGKTRRESEAVAREFSGLPPAQFEAKIFIGKSLVEKIERIKGLLAHSHPGLSTAELFEKLCDDFLAAEEKRNLARKRESARERDSSRNREMPRTNLREAARESAPTRNAAPIRSAKPTKNGRRAIPRELRRAIWRRDAGQCTNCGAQHALQIDHIHPLALGGIDAEANLRLLCRNCNQRAAIRIFGSDKMQGHFERAAKE